MDAYERSSTSGASLKVLVGLSVEPVIELAPVGNLDHTNPPFIEGILVEPLGTVDQSAVGLDDLAAHRGIDLRVRLEGAEK